MARGGFHLDLIGITPPPMFPSQVCLAATCISTNGLHDDRKFIHTIWELLRARFPACTIVFMPENNLGKEASHLEEWIRDDRGGVSVTMREGDKGWMGVRKTFVTTLEMHKQMAHLLSLNALHIMEDCIGLPTVGEQRKFNMKPGSDRARIFMLKKLRTQLLAYRWEETTSSTRLNATERVFRLTGKRSKLNDDLCICALMVPYWRNVFLQSANPAYTTAKVAMGLQRAVTGVPMDNPGGGGGGPADNPLAIFRQA